MEKKERKSTGFLIKQRAFLKLYVITSVEQGRPYGLQILEDLSTKFDDFGYKPQHSEIYRALHDLVEDGILTRKREKKEGAQYQEVIVYEIRDQEKAKIYKKMVKVDMDRSEQLLRKAIADNY